MTKSWAEILGDDTIPDTRPKPKQTGEEWFASLSESEQAQVLGPGKLAAYREGKITLRDLVGVKHSEDWGDTVYEKPLKELI